jgi:hypothetical protein
VVAAKSSWSANPIVKDPGIEYGHFRVLQRTDGPFIVCDFRRPLGRCTVAMFRTVEEADASAKRLHGLSAAARAGATSPDTKSPDAKSPDASEAA